MDDPTDRNEGVHSKLVLIPYRFCVLIDGGFHMGRQFFSKGAISLTISSPKKDEIHDQWRIYVTIAASIFDLQRC